MMRFFSNLLKLRRSLFLTSVLRSSRTSTGKSDFWESSDSLEIETAEEVFCAVRTGSLSIL